MSGIIPIENITGLIYLIRGKKVMLDRDLANLYGVETKRLKEQVKRNIERFPEDFMFELSKKEYENLRSQIATSSWGGAKMRQLVFESAELRKEIEKLKADVDGKFRIVFETLEQLLSVESTPKKKIGFTAKEKQAEYGIKKT